MVENNKKPPFCRKNDLCLTQVVGLTVLGSYQIFLLLALYYSGKKAKREHRGCFKTPYRSKNGAGFEYFDRRHRQLAVHYGDFDAAPALGHGFETGNVEIVAQAHRPAVALQLHGRNNRIRQAHG